jgi:GST-like protein
MHTLYGSQGSGSAAIEAALAMCGLPFRIVSAATWDAGSALAELARVNPLRQIPTLVLPGGAVLTESAAILIHLGLAHPHSGLLPAEAASRDQAIRGLVFIAANCYSAIGVIDYPERWLAQPDEAATDSLRQGARARLHRQWELFADIFAPPAAFFGGEGVGALDLLAAVVSKWSGARAHLRDARPGFSALLERIDAHPSVSGVLSRHWPA